MSTLAAARADNFYYPKDWDPSKGNITQHHLNKRKGPNGIEKPNKNSSDKKPPMKIRFEMMFNVRCLQCQNSIGKGVRFNAQKKTGKYIISTYPNIVGQYLSTKIYEFSMNCHLCSNRLIIKTDPKTCDYEIVSGLEKRPDDIKVDGEATTEPIDPNKREKIENNAFFKLENANEDRIKGEDEIPRLRKILELKEKDKDYFEWNSLLRKKMREKKHVLIKEEEEAKKPKNFGLQLINELDSSDLHRVQKIREIYSNRNYRENKIQARDQIKQQSIFGNSNQSTRTLNTLPINLRQQLQKNAVSNIHTNKTRETDMKSKVMKHLSRVNN